MPRYAKVHHAVRAIYAKAEEAPQNQTNHLSGGMSFFWVSHPHVLFLGQSVSRTNNSSNTNQLLTIDQQIKSLYCGNTSASLEQTKIDNFAQSPDSDLSQLLSQKDRNSRPYEIPSTRYERKSWLLDY